MLRGLLNYNIAAFDSDNAFGFPPVEAYTDKVFCTDWTGIDRAVTNTKTVDGGLHFFEADYKLGRLWEYPDRYIDVLRRYKYVIQPDFSLYYDFPAALQIYNKYRNHWLAAYYALYGVKVIPKISLSTPDQYYWTILGYPKRSVVAFSDLGCVRDKAVNRQLVRSYDYMLQQLDPLQVLYFTRGDNAPSEATVIKLPYIKGGK